MYLDGEFKFRSHESSWDEPDWGAGSSDGSLAEKGNNLKADAGYYQVNADIAAMTYSLTKITTIGIVGPAQDGGWDADTDMTYNKETGAWETTINLKADEMKFRANDGWDINWGGTADALTRILFHPALCLLRWKGLLQDYKEVIFINLNFQAGLKRPA